MRHQISIILPFLYTYHFREGDFNKSNEQNSVQLNKMKEKIHLNPIKSVTSDLTNRSMVRTLDF